MGLAGTHWFGVGFAYLRPSLEGGGFGREWRIRLGVEWGRSESPLGAQFLFLQFCTR